jgi:uncharacterized protein YutE (UPF0331/DUF86 family)
MVKIAVIQRLLNNLASYIGDLRNSTDITHDKYITDIRIQRFVERTLQISIECCFDIIHHIISDQNFREPDSYADSFSVLAEQGILSGQSVLEFQMMAQFRNKIVHYYDKIDPEQVYAIFKGKLDTFDSFKNQIDIWIGGQESKVEGSKEK